ncbi:DUF4251 domain-containing protein [Odoribacter sp. OttesenSCG-928-G04]|nr:DUF4251 domain-containing protein [Odoribacter sp. OttesenSCG-928-G04]
MLISIFLLSGMEIYAQQQPNTPTEQLSQKQLRAMEREQKRKAKEAEELQTYQDALQAINDKNWVLKANTVYNRKGKMIQVTDNTNFVQVKDNTVHVQLAFEGYGRQNGMGGITLEGTLSDMKTQTDKRGNTIYTFRVHGQSLTAEINMILSKGSNFAQATVTPLMGGRIISFSGIILPEEKADIYRSGFIRY